jgi:hypothetical protein
MERRPGAEPDPAINIAKRESRSFRRIQGGDAAKAAEEWTQESATYHRSFGMILRASRGARFELEKHPQGPGEACPLPSTDSMGQAPITPNEQPTGKASAGIATKLWRKLFRR